MKIIGFTGPPGCGKDTAFLAIQASFKTAGLYAERFSFADHLRATANFMLGDDYSRFWGGPFKDEPLAALNGHAPREMLIELGMLGRKYRPAVWLDKVMSDIGCSGADISVITDVRFHNEAVAVTEAGGELVHIDRRGFSYDPSRQSESGEAYGLRTLELVNDGDLQKFSNDAADLAWMIYSRGGNEAA
jgi:hypothetical protein